MFDNKLDIKSITDFIKESKATNIYDVMVELVKGRNALTSQLSYFRISEMPNNDSFYEQINEQVELIDEMIQYLN